MSAHHPPKGVPILLANWPPLIRDIVTKAIVSLLLVVTVGPARLRRWRGPLLDTHETRHVILTSSKNPKRRIRCNIYDPPQADNGSPLPVHINFHGSGFIIPALGSDDANALRWAKNVGCIVIDADYAKGPWDPFPAAFDDAMDVVSYVRANPHLYDTSRITLGGFSAGGNLAVGVAAQLGREVIKAVVVYYPVVDFSRDRPSRDYPRGIPGFPLFRFVRKTFNSAYIPHGTDTTDPRLSPIYARMDNVPPTTMIICEYDYLAAEDLEFVDKLKAAGGDVVTKVILNAQHGWDKGKFPPQYAESVEEAMKLCESRLVKAFQS